MTAAALVVHDLKNELGALEAALQQLALAAEPAPAAAAAAHLQCRTLRQRLVMYLALYGSEAELRAHADDESPGDLLQAMAARHAHSRVQVRVGAEGGWPPYCYLDRRLLSMAVDAAVHNALRFARSSVTLGLRPEPGHLVFTVDDDGPGLAGAEAADTEAVGPVLNTGLGTTLCRAVAQAHGCRRADGGVRLFDRDAAAGGGARFELWLPT